MIFRNGKRLSPTEEADLLSVSSGPNQFCFSCNGAGGELAEVDGHCVYLHAECEADPELPRLVAQTVELWRQHDVEKALQ